MSNVVNLKEFKNKPKPDETDTAKSDEVTETDFKDVMERNKRNAERIAKERANANNGVKRSHKLKPNDPNNKR